MAGTSSAIVLSLPIPGRGKKHPHTSERALSDKDSQLATRDEDEAFGSDVNLSDLPSDAKARGGFVPSGSVESSDKEDDVEMVSGTVGSPPTHFIAVDSEGKSGTRGLQGHGTRCAETGEGQGCLHPLQLQVNRPEDKVNRRQQDSREGSDANSHPVLVVQAELQPVSDPGEDTGMCRGTCGVGEEGEGLLRQSPFATNLGEAAECWDLEASCEADKEEPPSGVGFVNAHAGAVQLCGASGVVQEYEWGGEDITTQHTIGDVQTPAATDATNGHRRTDPSRGKSDGGQKLQVDSGSPARGGDGGHAPADAPGDPTRAPDAAPDTRAQPNIRKEGSETAGTAPEALGQWQTGGKEKRPG
ncbi:hypothetical protein HDU93_002963, partial [Gonapodya sp. JEL0774]